MPTGETPGLPSLQDLENQFSQLTAKIKVENLWFNGKEVRLDGYHFAHCRFDNCVLTLYTSSFELTGCIVDPTTKVTWQGELISVLKLFNRENEHAYREFPDFVPTRNADGTITISASPF